MDKSSISIGILLLILFVFPIIYVLIKQSAKDNRSKKLLSQIALDKNINLDCIEIIGHISLGLDSTLKKLIVLENNDLGKVRIIELRNVQEIKIIKKEELYFQKEIKKVRIVHLGLDFISALNEPSTELTLYDEDDPDSTNASISLNNALKWDKILQGKISC